jgi:hypothetical protein
MNVCMALVYRLHPWAAGTLGVWCRGMLGRIATMVFVDVWRSESWSRCLG